MCKSSILDLLQCKERSPDQYDHTNENKNCVSNLCKRFDNHIPWLSTAKIEVKTSLKEESSLFIITSQQIQKYIKQDRFTQNIHVDHLFFFSVVVFVCLTVDLPLTVEFLPKWFCLIHNLMQPLLLTSLLFFKSDCILIACQKKIHKNESIDSEANLFQFNMLLKTDYDKENELWKYQVAIFARSRGSIEHRLSAFYVDLRIQVYQFRD